MHWMLKISRLSLVAMILALPAMALAQSQTTPAQTEKAAPPGELITSKNVDPNLFEPSNQKECDFPSPCGCDCDPTKPGPKVVKPDLRPPVKR